MFKQIQLHNLTSKRLITSTLELMKIDKKHFNRIVILFLRGPCFGRENDCWDERLSVFREWASIYLPPTEQYCNDYKGGHLLKESPSRLSKNTNPRVRLGLN